MGVDAVIERVEGDGGDARAKLRRLFALTSSGPRGFLNIELAIRDWARRDKAVAKRLRRVDERRFEYMRSLFGDFCRDEDEVEVRCLLFASLWIGDQLFPAIRHKRTRADATALALSQLLA